MNSICYGPIRFLFNNLQLEWGAIFFPIQYDSSFLQWKMRYLYISDILSVYIVSLITTIFFSDFEALIRWTNMHLWMWYTYCYLQLKDVNVRLKAKWNSGNCFATHKIRTYTHIALNHYDNKLFAAVYLLIQLNWMKRIQSTLKKLSETHKQTKILHLNPSRKAVVSHCSFFICDGIYGCVYFMFLFFQFEPINAANACFQSKCARSCLWILFIIVDWKNSNTLAFF